MKKVGHISKFPFGICWWTLKNLKNQNFDKNWKNKCWRYHHFTHLCQKPQSCEVQFMRYRVRQFFCHFGPFFCPLTLLTTQRIKILKKWTKTPRYIIIWHKCTINDNHMIYGSWNINCIRQIFFVILGHFLPFYPPNSSAQKMKISNKWKIWMEMSSFFTRVTKIMIICYVVPEI